ncbi:hypothetical protein Tco_0439983 [Tanacetum coccineum]
MDLSSHFLAISGYSAFSSSHVGMKTTIFDPGISKLIVLVSRMYLSEWNFHEIQYFIVDCPDCEDSQFCHFIKEFVTSSASFGIRFLIFIDLSRSGYHQKDRKPSQNDKTEHGMEKDCANQGRKVQKCQGQSKLRLSAGQSGAGMKNTIECNLDPS